MAMTGVLRPGHVALRVLELEPAVAHYTEILGLIETGRDVLGRVYLKAWDEHDHHCVVLREADSAGLDYMGFKVEDEETLASLRQRLVDSGLEVQVIPAGEHLATGQRIRFTAPTGHAFELYAQKDVVGNGMPTINPGIEPEGLKGIHPSRLDHCALFGDDLDGAVNLFTEVLGFNVTETIEDGDTVVAAFLSCGTKAHDLAFVRQPCKGKLHHLSFHVDSWSDILRAADIIARKDVSHDVGPTRHGATRGETIYFFDPSGNRNEVFCGGYIWYPDRPRLKWTVDELPRSLFYTERRLKETFLSTVT